MTNKMTIANVAYLVRDYDEALNYFTQVLRFELIEDRQITPDKRWLVVAPAGSAGAKLLLAKASTPEQMSHVGDQTGGRVFLFLETEDFWETYKHLESHKVSFTEKPREEAYGTVVVFVDLYGNKWDLIGRS
ncbi:VOC family protein [Undibacterium flavidum]|uniref:VOC family protein n=1 Tax=Undibacterium flavidum TaxID=2762297 RepID=A0ABR6Y7A7_9BURK|nr:VOC family protein [Undibacterium flavidum]MBC3872493.1 VOC family protein [Undibacterium flavidum]